MPKRITRGTVILNRDGKRVIPPIGRLFDYTSKELDQITKLSPDAVEKPQEPTKEYIDPSVEKAAAAKAAADEAAAKAAADEAAAKAAADKDAADKGNKGNKGIMIKQQDADL